jgi:glyoxylase-like metal-dependent hydrolase (beta-lactamase superfamily II)
MNMVDIHVLTIGRFSRNRFWGELDTVAYRDAVCTSSLIRGKTNIVVDPSQAPDEMAQTLYNRSGLRPENIDFVFLTHSHGDHFVGLELFENATWVMSQTDLVPMKQSGQREQELATHIQGVDSGELTPGISFVSVPGHTLGTMALLTQSSDGKVAICGDAVMTRDFFRAGVGYYNCVDFEKSTASIAHLASLANIIVPGHDNYFLVN